MTRSAFPIRIIGVVGVIVLLALVVAGPAGALSSLYQANTPEPGTRTPPAVLPSPTPQPYIELDPSTGIAGDPNSTTIRGYNYRPNQPVTFLFDDAVNTDVTAPVWSGTTFQAVMQIPIAAVAGIHTIRAAQLNFGLDAQAEYTLIQPTPAPPTATFTPTNTPMPTNTPTQTPTPTPSPTLRPVTPMVTITPIPPTKAPPPAPTRTPSPMPGTLTFTPTPSDTPLPSDTPGPGTPSATVAPTLTPSSTPTPIEEISDTGGGWGTIFLWGFVLAGLLVVFRLLRVRGLPEQG